MILQSIIIFIIPWTCRTKVQVNRLDLETWDLWDKHRRESDEVEKDMKKQRSRT